MNETEIRSNADTKTIIKPSVKLWLKVGKISVIGSGRARLLRAIAAHGSISKAATTMGMSYRHAWGIIKQVRQSVGEEVVLTSRGGASGGGTRLTKFGRMILEQFEKYEKDIEKLMKYGPKPILAVDGIILTENKELVLIKRKNEPFKGRLALPGGFVEYNETTEQAVIREVFEELGIRSKIKKLLGVYSDPTRDPRQHTISAVYELKPLSSKFHAGDDAADFKIISLDDVETISSLAFDHSKIVNDAIKNLMKNFNSPI